MIESSKDSTASDTLRYGMVGGGQGAFIGDVHRKAIGFDAKAEIVAGCFSRDQENTRQTGAALHIDPERLYASFQEMAEAEGQRADTIDFVSIVTPNNTHFPIAKAFLEQGIHVVCDKPLTLEVAEAEELRRLANEHDLLFCVTYTYTGYPMVKHAREMIQRGDIGEIRFVKAEYPQEWLATPLEHTGHRQASWRTDPTQTGKANSVGDIGSHVENMISYLTGLKIISLCARLDSFVEGRTLDDNASILVAYDTGAKGLYWVSQIAVGHDNDLTVGIYGTKGAIEWSQEDPNYLHVAYLGKPQETLSRGRDELYPHATGYSRVPGGHPEGYFEAFANIYSTFASALLKKKAGGPLTDADLDFPSVEDGLSGVKFITACVESSQQGAVWLEV
ncbi:gfo/Idh/MocA family oxidoreductase [candidate division KSB3 bacterium]|uniref:Gfo/Idh/MocA family oxidoreductase n=1 Tax=candidate division KSB3 bacterium TaxID=2044937 RepID=A0A9D5Q3Y9_9BACT|nr:gfo/Idh/MocA family oxidoreductase [candidate division KSB3 bacterium]MBD3323159.1 gfo/Idh/MocA family oxidoreductase [candidate division KSB3 bacterium]